MSLWLKIPLSLRVFVGLLLGIAAGFGLQTAANGGSALAHDAVGWIKVAGDFFTAIIKMLVAPLVFLAITAGVVSLGSLRKIRGVGFRAVFVLLVTTIIAACVGAGLGHVFQPGAGFDPFAPPASPMLGSNAPTVAEQLLGLAPENPVASMARGDVLQIFVFALLFGIGLNFARENGAAAARALEGAAEALIKISGGVMELAPFGVFALMAAVAATFDVQAMGPLATLVALLYAGCAVHALIVYGGLIRIICNLPFLRFLGGVLTPFSVAIATISSNATVPATMHAVERNFGVSNRVASFVVSLGSTLNKDGTAMFLALVAIFGAQAYNVALDPSAYAIIIAMAVLGAVGAAGVPGAGLIISSLVLSAVNVPLETIAVLAAIDRILDMPRTALNVLGDCSASVVVAKWENELDQDIFRGKNTPMDELVTDESPAKQQA